LFNKLQTKIDTLIEQKNSITIDDNIYDKLKEHLKDKNISIKDYIENLIKDSLIE
jgi:predicted CopG family antitoxin